MKITYLLESYDTIFRQTFCTLSNTTDIIYEALCDKEKYAYRIYEIEIKNDKNKEQLKVLKCIHSFHPDALTVDWKSIFHCNELVNYIPLLKSIIDFTGEPIEIAKHPEDTQKFFIAEKSSINEIPAKERKLLYTHQMLKEENVKIISAIKNQVFKYKTNQKIEHFIHKVQMALECQLRHLIKNIDPKTTSELYVYGPKSHKTDSLKCQFYHLEKLLIFLEEEYAEYLNDKLMVPYRTILKDEVELTSKIQWVRNHLLAMEIEKELLQILYDPILNLGSLHLKDKISYYQYNYAKNYVVEMAEWLTVNPNGCSIKEWCDWLIKMHVNSFQCFGYISTQLKKEFEDCVSEREQLDLMFEYLKIYNQAKTIQGVSYQEKLPEIQFQLYRWIEEEIEILSRKRELTQKLENHTEITEDSNKIELEASVAQIACFTDLVMKGGLIKNKNRKEVFQILSCFIKTDKTETISVDSLRSKSYNVESSTNEAIIEVLEKLLKLAKS